jgi:lipoic acid synthetase
MPTVVRRHPEWLRVRLPGGDNYAELKGLMRGERLHTVCEEARCPNLAECWGRRTATFMILGDVCTRSCGFCAVKTGRPTWLDPDEPRRVAEAVRQLGLRHVVVTSVNRDELEDGGAATFARTIAAIREAVPGCAVEVLIPDFRGDRAALERVTGARPDVLAHNTETVPRLHPTVRPQARYERSLEVIQRAKSAGMRTKSGLMLGLGERREELHAVLGDLVASGCDVLTLGQYLQPTRAHLPVHEYLRPEVFAELKAEAEALGFAHVESGPLVRSSYHADEHV